MKQHVYGLGDNNKLRILWPFSINSEQLGYQDAEEMMMVRWAGYRLNRSFMLTLDLIMRQKGTILKAYGARQTWKWLQQQSGDEKEIGLFEGQPQYYQPMAAICK